MATGRQFQSAIVFGKKENLKYKYRQENRNYNPLTERLPEVHNRQKSNNL